MPILLIITTTTIMGQTKKVKTEKINDARSVTR
jgi:hypothetical protein